METYTLKYPLERDGEEPITELKVRRPRVRDIEAFQRATADFGQSMNSIASATDAMSIAIASGADPSAAAAAASPALGGLTEQAVLAGGAAMLASMNGLDVELIRDLDIDDFTALQELVAGFTPAARSGNGGA